jgi:hypothetical protein
MSTQACVDLALAAANVRAALWRGPISGGEMSRRRTIDVHTHILTEEAAALLRKEAPTVGLQVVTARVDMAMPDCVRHVQKLAISENDKLTILTRNAEALLPVAR